ncbi:LCP family protein [Candidatus Poriferisodalis sp.]|uniref:LCP family protein n=1 Tax=Candidatus Poriferisodalis sp. TaxID=3101277 RepID=UPI003B01EB04
MVNPRREVRGRHPLTAAALSAVLPGFGHFGYNNRRAYALIITSVAAMTAAVAYVSTRSATTLLIWSVSPTRLRLVIIGAVVLLLLRVAVAVDVYMTVSKMRLLKDQGVLRLWSVVRIAALSAIVLVPHALVIQYASAQLRLLTRVFAAAETRAVTPSPVVRVTVSEAAVPTPAAPSAPTPAPSPDSVPTTEALPQTWDGAERLTVALLGGDGGFDRTGVRTDTIIVVSIDADTGAAAAFNVPRNWRHLTFPDGTPAALRWPDGYPEIANEIHGLGQRSPELFPDVEDPAGHAIKSALAELTGLPIQYYVLIDMQGLVKAIDLFGGIDVYVTEAINDRIRPITEGGSPIDIVVEPGEHHFDGLTALGYVRSRRGSSDYHRMTRQRCVVEALIDQNSPLEMLLKYPALSDTVSKHVHTDIPLDRLDEMLALSRTVDTSRIVTVNFIPPEFPRGSAPTAKVRAAVAQALRGTTEEANVSLAESCRAPT